MSGTLLDSGNVNNYTIGGTRILFAEQLSVGVFGEYFDLGNIVSAAITAAIDRLEHYTAKSGARIKDRTVVRQSNFSVPFSFDEPNPYNLNTLFMGDAQPATAAADTAVITGEAHTCYTGRAFFLPKFATATALVVKDVTDVTTYVLNTDYTLVTLGKMIGIIAKVGGAITDATVVHVTYTKAVPAGKSINPLYNPSKSGKAILQFVSETGNNFMWEIPSTLISPDGDFSYNDQDWSQVKMRLDVQSNGGANPYGLVTHFGVGSNLI
jgi:hypothetical protein